MESVIEEKMYPAEPNMYLWERANWTRFKRMIPSGIFAWHRQYTEVI